MPPIVSSHTITTERTTRWVAVHRNWTTTIPLYKPGPEPKPTEWAGLSIHTGPSPSKPGPAHH